MQRQKFLPGIMTLGAASVAAACLMVGAVGGDQAAYADSTDDSGFRLAVPLESSDLEVIGERDSFVSAYRRLTESQYRHTIADIFGDDIVVAGRFEPERREEFLQAVGNARLSVTTSGLEQFYSLSRTIAQQVIDSEGRAEIIGCDIPEERTAARACAEDFVSEVGAKLYRRPLTEAEQALSMAIWDSAAEANGSTEAAFEITLASMLLSPEFLFRTEVAERVGDTEEFRLDAYSMASRISYFLWDTMPDAELMASAESGALHTEEGLITQVSRMIESPRIEEGVRAFFSDMFYFEAFETLTKDPETYPKFSQAVADSAKEETLRFLVRHLIDKDADYRDIFTSRETVINRTLAAVYNVPYPSREAWADFEFDEGSQRSGVLTQVSFTALFSHPGSSSPTLRGKYLQEIFQCLPIPDPPADVDFSKVQALESGTVRERLEAHRSDPTCATCHVLMDPAGLALENFDSLGQFRSHENGDLIDVSADLNGTPHMGAPGVGQYLHDNPQTASCVTQKAISYGEGRPFDYANYSFLTETQEAFADDGYRLKTLFRTILTDPVFYDVIVPEGMQERETPAAVETQPAISGGR